jgi:hypothetical protein
MTTEVRMKRVFGRQIVTTAIVGFALLIPHAAWAAKDRVEVKVNQGAPQIVALTEGGSPLAQGAFSSSSSIKIQYELVALNFPAGSNTFGTFTLGLRILDRSTDPGADSDYSPALTLTLGQNGNDAPQLQLSPSPSSVPNIAGAGDLGSSTVTITTNCTLANPCPTVDGSELVANLQFAGTNELDTAVKVQVRIKLVHPAGPCLHLYNFLTDQELISDVTSTEVGVVKSGRNAGKVTSTTPFGQFSDNALVANTCSGISAFDLEITLDPSFDTNPNDNPGNAVFTYFAGQVVDPETFNIGSFGEGTPQGQTLCFANISLDANQSFLTTVHMGIRRGMPASALTPSPFTFTAQISEPNATCGQGTVLATQSGTMSYTIK